MTNEIDQLGLANPIAPEALERAVAVDRQTLVEMLEADSGDSRFWHSKYRASARVPVTRLGYAGVIVTAAAALVAVAFLGAEEPQRERDEVGPAGQSATVVSVVVDDPEDIPVTSQVVVTGPANEASVDRPPAIDEQGGSYNDDEPETTTADAPPQTTPALKTVDGPFDPQRDLLAVHFDFAHRDDGHAAVATRELATSFGVTPHLVSGTAALESDRFTHDYAALMQLVWGEQWFDATADRPTAVATSVQRWLVTIEGGGRVWIAEGGVSDFTAEVLREITTQRPDLDTRATVQVVQHNGGNESESIPENQRFVAENTTYIRIEDGNDDNATADLNQQSDGFEAVAEVGRYRRLWSEAFVYLPAAELDFSDTVEVLYVLGVGKDEVANPDDFANRFMG